MGLTGVVVRAVLKLHHVETAYFVVDTEQIDNLDDLIGALRRRTTSCTASRSSWFDAVTTGPHFGRGLLMRGRLATLDRAAAQAARRPAEVRRPAAAHRARRVPARAAQQASPARLFSEVWYRKSPTHGAARSRTSRRSTTRSTSFGEWNRGYGPRGFLQYQFVVPLDRERRDPHGRWSG